MEFSRIFTKFAITFNTINTFKKYLFSLIVAAYVTATVGIPVYLHYCGGELEDISYVLRKVSCCGEEEEEPSEDGCCKDQNLVLRESPDFTLKNAVTLDVVKIFCSLFFIETPFQLSCVFNERSVSLSDGSPPGAPPSDILLSISVLRI